MTEQKNEGDLVAAGASMPGDAHRPLEVLRDATGEYHRQLEGAIDWAGAFQSLPSYRQLLERFARVVPPLERALARHLAPLPQSQFDPSLRTRWLEADLAVLAALTASTQAVAVAGQLPPEAFAYIDSMPAAIGALYVLEGSTLGGQFLSRQLREHLQLTPDEGGAYFAAYGAATGQHWQAFKQWAGAQLTDPVAVQQAADAAKTTFLRFGKALADLAHE